MHIKFHTLIMGPLDDGGGELCDGANEVKESSSRGGLRGTLCVIYDRTRNTSNKGTWAACVHTNCAFTLAHSSCRRRRRHHRPRQVFANTRATTFEHAREGHEKTAPPSSHDFHSRDAHAGKHASMRARAWH